MTPVVEVEGAGKRFDPAASPFGTSTTLGRVLLRRRGADAADDDPDADIDDADDALEDDAADDFGAPAGAEPVWAVRDLSFTLAQDGTLGVIGASGSGKSTVLRLVAGVTPLTIGRVMVRGRVGPLAAVSSLFMRPEASARDNATTAALVSGASRRDARRAAREACELIGLDPRDPVPGGVADLRRLAAMVAVTVPADVLLLDGLPAGGAETPAAFEGRLCQALAAGSALLLTGTERADVARFCTDVLVLEGGQPAAAAGRDGGSGPRLKWGRTRLWTSPFHKFGALNHAAAAPAAGGLTVEVMFEAAVPGLGVRGRVELVLDGAVHVVEQPTALRCEDVGRYLLEGHLPADLLPRGTAVAHIAMEIEYTGVAKTIEREDCFAGELAGTKSDPGRTSGGVWNLRQLVR